jgi:hypothetical protein
MSEPQQIINVGEVANDGTGESLRDAFNAVNNNFANVWAAGPVDSQVVISNNRISTNETNLDLILAGNGVGNVVLSSTTVPSIDSVYDIGSPVRYFDTTYSRYYYGNGAFLTGISGGGNANYSNANVAAYLPTYTGNLVSLTGPVVTTANVTGGNIRTGGTVSATGNITGANVIAASYTGTTVSVTGNIASANLNLSGNLSIAGNVNSALTVRANITGTNVITGGTVSAAGNISTLGAVSALGNVTGNYFVGNGSQLTGIVASGGSSIDNGTSNVKIPGANANVTVSVNSVSNVAVFTTTGLSVAGNVTAVNFIGNVIGNISGNLTVPGANTEVLFNNNGVVGTDNAFTFNSTTNVLSVAGNVVAGNFIGNGQALSSVMADRGGDSNNWNTLIQMGVYTVNRTSWSGTSGTPLDSQVFVGLLQVSNSTNTAIEQVFFPGTVEDGNVKIQWNRAYWSGTWTAWVRIVNDFQVVTGGEF